MNYSSLKNSDKVRLLAPAITRSGGVIPVGVYQVSELSPDILKTGRWKLLSNESEKTVTAPKKLELVEKKEIKPEA